MTKRLQEACKEWGEDLVLYYYGECRDAERSRVERHLEACASCRQLVEDLRALLPGTVRPDDPPQRFWQDYSRELRRKLDAQEEKGLGWKDSLFWLRPWPVVSMATAAVLILALTLTFGRGKWRPQKFLMPDESVLEILPMAENAEFFRAMELLDSLDLLEAAPGLGNGPTRDGGAA